MDDPWLRQRRKLVELALRRGGLVDERMLAAMEKVPRHLFVPLSRRELAYEDIALPYREDQTISQPYIVGLMTELLALKGDETVLEIGTGTGYQTAVLAELSREVFTVERIASFVAEARNLLLSLGYDNITCRQSDGTAGWPEPRTFDRIIVTAAPPELPEGLAGQLVPGGILVIPLGQAGGPQYLYRYLKTPDGGLVRDRIIPVRFVPLICDTARPSGSSSPGRSVPAE